MPSLVLASSSPRRAALLSESGFEFDVTPPRVAEKFDAALTLRELTLWNAIRKGMSVAQTRPDAVVLAADTLVALKNEIIGKPANLDEATEVLQRLSGRTHEVCSAVLIYHQTLGRLVVFALATLGFLTALSARRSPTQAGKLAGAGVLLNGLSLLIPALMVVLAVGRLVISAGR